MTETANSQPIRIKPPEKPIQSSPRKIRSRAANLSPIIENGPIHPQKVLEKYLSLLMPYEIAEIIEYKEVFYIGDREYKNMKITDFFNKVNPNDHISYRYKIEKVIGTGSYGKVIEAYDYKEKKTVAIKILKNKMYSKREASALALVNKNKCSNTVKGLSYFLFRNCACISFELVGENLHSIMNQNKFLPFKESIVKDYALQMFKSLEEYSKLGLTHCDLKPQNICLSLDDPKKIKIIDFGISYINKVDNCKITYTQTRYYRSPEVILHLDYGPEIDIWSAGLVIIELLIGKPVFPGRNELEMLNLMVELLGNIPPSMVKASRKKGIFFINDSSLKPFNGNKAKKKYTVRNLVGQDKSYYLIDFIKKCLCWNPKNRITAAQALEHPWLKEELFIIPTFDKSNLPVLHE